MPLPTPIFSWRITSLMRTSLHYLRELKELGITTLDYIKNMWQQWLPTSVGSTTFTSPIHPLMKALAAKLPQLTPERTCPWFKKLKN